MTHHSISVPQQGYTRREVFKAFAAAAALGCVAAGSPASSDNKSTGTKTDAEPLSVKNRKLKVAGLVIERRKFDPEGNMRELCELVPRAAEKGAKLLVTPEGFLEGYIVQTKGLTAQRYSQVAETIPGGKHFERMCALARENGVYLAAGMAEKLADHFYNACALIDPQGNLVGKYRKTHTLSDEGPNTQGDSFPVFQTELGRIGIMICYDRQPPEVARLLTLHGADIILNPAAGSWGETNTMMVRTRAYENGVPIVFSHFAECLIIDRKGNLVNRYEEGEDHVVVAEIETGRGKSTIDYRKPELYTDLCDPNIRPGRI